MATKLSNTGVVFPDLTTQTTAATTGVTSAVAGTGVSVSAATGAVTFTNSGVTSIVAGSGISISGGTGAVTVTASGGGVTSYIGATGAVDPSVLNNIGNIQDAAVIASSPSVSPSVTTAVNTYAVGNTQSGGSLAYNAYGKGTYGNITPIYAPPSWFILQPGNPNQNAVGFPSSGATNVSFGSNMPVSVAAYFAYSTLSGSWRQLSSSQNFKWYDGCSYNASWSSGVWMRYA
jgi:hypothetical protein